MLADQPPDLHQALERAKREGFSHVVPDGKIILADRRKEQTVSIQRESVNARYSGQSPCPRRQRPGLARPGRVPAVGFGRGTRPGARPHRRPRPRPARAVPGLPGGHPGAQGAGADERGGNGSGWRRSRSPRSARAGVRRCHAPGGPCGRPPGRRIPGTAARSGTACSWLARGTPRLRPRRGGPGWRALHPGDHLGRRHPPVQQQHFDQRLGARPVAVPASGRQPRTPHARW